MKSRISIIFGSLSLCSEPCNSQLPPPAGSRQGIVQVEKVTMGLSIERQQNRVCEAQGRTTTVAFTVPGSTRSRTLQAQ